MKKIIATFAFASVFIACKPEAQPIDYGKQDCHFCQMTIVDKQHAAQIVTNTGKAFSYDAIECMIQDEQPDAQLFFVCDYAHPEKLIDATQATFLVSENVPSPMGANLSAFSDKNTAEALKNEKTGSLFSWEAIKNYIFEENQEGDSEESVTEMHHH